MSTTHLTLGFHNGKEITIDKNLSNICFKIEGNYSENDFNNGHASFSATAIDRMVGSLKDWYIYDVQVNWNWNDSYAYAVLSHKKTKAKICVALNNNWGSNAGKVTGEEVIIKKLQRLFAKINDVATNCDSEASFYLYKLKELIK